MEIRINPGETVTIIGGTEDVKDGNAYVPFALFKEALDRLCAGNARIVAIKLYRSHTGAGLKESKDWVWQNCPAPTPEKGRKCWDCAHRDLSHEYTHNVCFWCLRGEELFERFEPRELGQILSEAGYIPRVE